MPCLLASCAAVSSPRSASRATFALKSAEYRFRLPVIQVRPSQEQTELNLLSEFPGPPHYMNRAGEPSGFGPGDLELGVKYRFLTPGEEDWFPAAAIFPAIEVPVGNQQFSASTGHAQIFLPLWLQKDFGRWSTYGGGGYWVNPGAGNRDFWFF